MSELVDRTRHPDPTMGPPLRLAAGALSFLSVTAVAVTAVVPAAARAADQPPLRTLLSALCLCVVGMTIGILGSRGTTSPRRLVRIAWNGAALGGLAATCVWGTPGLAAGANGKVLAALLWAGTGAATLVVLRAGGPSATTVVRAWALASPWLLLALWGVLAAAVAASFDVAATALTTPVFVVAIGAVALVPGLLVREAMESLRGEGLAARLVAGPRAARGVWLVLVVKTLVTLGTVVLGVWRWRAVPDVRSWICGTGAVLLLVAMLALDHRVAVFRRNDSRVAAGAGLVVSLPLVVVVAGAMLLLTAGTVVRAPGPPVALLLLIVAVVALRHTWSRRTRWWVIATTTVIGVACGVVAMAGATSLPSGAALDLTVPFLASGVVVILGLFALELVVLVALAVVRRAWRLPVMVAALAVWVLWNNLVGGPQNGWTTNLLLSLALLYALILRSLGRQTLVDRGELLRFGVASLLVVDLPYLANVLPAVLAPWVLALGLGIPAVALAVGIVRGTSRLRALAFAGAVFGPLLAARLVTQFLVDGNLAESLEALVKGLVGLLGLPLAALLSTGSAQPNSPNAVTVGRHAG